MTFVPPEAKLALRMRLEQLTEILIQWYYDNRILYPWRRTTNPYRIWLSEILLQQTRIPVALLYYPQILKRFPVLRDLVDASEEEFLAMWSGIGYYRRARNMLRAARRVVSSHKGRFPAEVSSLLALPGIGRYTAGAIRNICFHQLTPAVDANIRRVLARLTNSQHRINTKIFRERIERAFMEMGEGVPSGDFFQSLMELGERICLPRPLCGMCPIGHGCEANRRETVLRVPKRLSHKKAATYHWYFLLLQKGNAFYFVQNPQRAFLKEAWLFPDFLTTAERPPKEIQRHFLQVWNIQVSQPVQVGTINHAVTFRRIHGHILQAEEYRANHTSGKWLTPEELKRYPTSSVAFKAIRAACSKSF